VLFGVGDMAIATVRVIRETRAPRARVSRREVVLSGFIIYYVVS
jgi:hypothetical protein